MYEEDYEDEWDKIEELAGKLGLEIEGTGGGIDYPRKDFEYEGSPEYQLYARVVGEGGCGTPERLGEPAVISFGLQGEDDDELLEEECCVPYRSVRIAMKALAKMNDEKANQIVRKFISKRLDDFEVRYNRVETSTTRDRRGTTTTTTVRTAGHEIVKALSERHAEAIFENENEDVEVVEVIYKPKPRRRSR